MQKGQSKILKTKSPTNQTSALQQKAKQFYAGSPPATCLKRKNRILTMPAAMSLASSPINKLDKNRNSIYKQLTRKSLACVLSTSTLSPIKTQENKLSMTQDDLLEISYFVKILDNKRQ